MQENTAHTLRNTGVISLVQKADSHSFQDQESWQHILYFYYSGCKIFGYADYSVYRRVPPKKGTCIEEKPLEVKIVVLDYSVLLMHRVWFCSWAFSCWQDTQVRLSQLTVLPELMQYLPGYFLRQATEEDFLSHLAQTCLLPWYK